MPRADTPKNFVHPSVNFFTMSYRIAWMSIRLLLLARRGKDVNWLTGRNPSIPSLITVDDLMLSLRVIF
jgi:hypothetical protein